MFSAPVEDKIFSSSNSTPGNDTASEPVLITIFLVSIFFSSSLLFIDILFLSNMLPYPLK